MLNWIVLASVFVCECGDTVKLPGRQESIIGKTYFGSERLLNTEIDDIKPFIADFTLPENALEVTGSINVIHETLTEKSRTNLTVKALVLHLYANMTKAEVTIGKVRLLDIPRYLGDTEYIEELWLFLYCAEIQSDACSVEIMVNISTASFGMLKHLQPYSRRLTSKVNGNSLLDS